MRHVIVAIAIASIVGVPIQAAERGILETALERVLEVQPVVSGCAAASTAGATDGRQRQGSAGWFAGGLLLPVIMPIVAHVSTPQPPADTVLQFSGDDARCYSASYSDAAASKRKKGAWIGSATAIGLMVVVIATAEGTGYGY